MTAYAALFTDDADLVNIRGGWWHGRALIEERMTALNQTVFRASHLVPTAIAVRFLPGNVALAHIPWELTGLVDRAGLPVAQPLHTLTTWTLTEEGNTWQIAAFQNTEVAPLPPE